MSFFCYPHLRTEAVFHGLLLLPQGFSESLWALHFLPRQAELSQGSPSLLGQRLCSVWPSSLPLPLHQAGLPLPPSSIATLPAHPPSYPLSSLLASAPMATPHQRPFPSDSPAPTLTVVLGSAPSFNAGLPLPCEDVSPPGQTLGCRLSPWSPLPSRCHYIYFDGRNLI